MEIFDKIKKKIKYEFLKRIKPEIIGWQANSDQHFRGKTNNTRISNIAHISFPQNIELADNVFIGHFNYIDGFIGVKIGEGCQITSYVSILSHSSHHAIRMYGDKYTAYYGSKMKGLRYAKVEIGAYTFIGPHAIIMPGSVIGKGCIIAAYTFIDGKVEDYSIMRGQPAKLVGDSRRVDEELMLQFPELREFYYDKANRNAPNT